MKICFISGALPDVSCGIGDYLDVLARALVRHGHEVVVVTTASPELRSPAEYRVVPIQTDWSFREAGCIAAVARREQAEVVHLQFPGVGYGRGLGACFAPWATRLRGSTPLLAATLHEFRRYRFRHKARLALAAAACDLVIAPDDNEMASIRRHLKWRPGLHTEMIPVAANFWPMADNVSHPGPLDGRDLVVGHWGFLRPDKGVEVLLESFARVVANRPARLILAGDPGPDLAYVASISKMARDLGLSPHLQTTGKLPVEQLSAVVRSFDVCVLPFREGLGQNRTTYSASKAHGVYVVTTSLQRSGFETDSNTTFVAPGDIDALTSAILDAPNHPRLGVPVTSDSEWDQIADAHLAAYRSARKELNRRATQSGY
jgi:glycosyltransferase involved in cell wall biosynthesis